jgi:hypothetical protein
MTTQEGHGWRALGCAVLLQAHKDAQSTNGDKAAREAGLPPGVTLSSDARQFLASGGAAWLCAALDLDPRAPAQAVGNLPPPDYEQMALSL